MNKSGGRLSNKLSINIMLLAAPVFIISLGLFYLQSRYLIRKEAIERSNSILHTTVQRVSNYMRTIEVSTNANAWLLEENFRPDSLQSISQRIVQLNPHIISCSVSAIPDMFPQYGQLSMNTLTSSGTSHPSLRVRLVGLSRSANIPKTPLTTTRQWPPIAVRSGQSRVRFWAS